MEFQQPTPEILRCKTGWPPVMGMSLALDGENPTAPLQWPQPASIRYSPLVDWWLLWHLCQPSEGTHRLFHPNVIFTLGSKFNITWSCKWICYSAFWLNTLCGFPWDRWWSVEYFLHPPRLNVLTLSPVSLHSVQPLAFLVFPWPHPAISHLRTRHACFSFLVSAQIMLPQGELSWPLLKLS